jgi:dUTP pyrophosphatase
VYLKNRLPHRITKTTPYQAYTGTKPIIKKLRVFGCPVVARLPGKRPAKLDNHAAMGIFLGFTATEHNIYYQDIVTKKIKIATHIAFYEAGYTIPKTERTFLQQSLQMEEIVTPPITTIVEQQSATDDNALQVTRLTPYAQLPRQGSPDAAGYDLHAAQDVTIWPHTIAKVPTDIAITPPPGTYCQILSCSGLFTTHGIETKAGTIDRDYTGNVQVILQNNSEQPYHITTGSRIAQMVIYKIAQPKVSEVPSLPTTTRGEYGFGSTGTTTPIINSLRHDPTPAIINQDGIKSYNIWLSPDPFNQRIYIPIDVKGSHPTLGLLFQPAPHQNRLQLMDMVKSTPGNKIPRWRSTIKRALLLSFNNEPIHSNHDLIAAINNARANSLATAQCEFATTTHHALHPTEGSLMLYYDQLNVIAKHLSAAYPTRQQHPADPSSDPTPAPNITHSNATKGKIRQTQDPNIGESDI